MHMYIYLAYLYIPDLYIHVYICIMCTCMYIYNVQGTHVYMYMMNASVGKCVGVVYIFQIRRFINPRRACAGGLRQLGLCVCVSVT